MALSAVRNTTQKGDVTHPPLAYLPVAASTKIYQGALVVLNSGGYAAGGTSATSLIAVGRAEQTADNTAGSNGDIYVLVRQGVFKWDVNGTSMSVTSRGSLCWVYDDHTVTLTSTSRSIAGTVFDFDADGGAWVYTAYAAPIDGSTISSVASDLSQYESDVASTSSLKGAALVGINDTASLITATTVEAALQEIFKAVYGFGVAPQALSGAGAANVTALVTNFTSTGSAQALSLANGTYPGQLKVIHHTVDGGSGVLTPTTAGNFATFTLTNVHDAALLQWTGSAWNIVLNVGGTVA